MILYWSWQNIIIYNKSTVDLNKNSRKLVYKNIMIINNKIKYIPLQIIIILRKGYSEKIKDEIPRYVINITII